MLALAAECCGAGAGLTATVWYSAWPASEDVDLPDWHKPVEAGQVGEDRDLVPAVERE